MLSQEQSIVSSERHSATATRIGAMIRDIHSIELDHIEPAVFALGCYKQDEKLDERCLHLVALLKILYFASRLEFPLQSVEGVKADARELIGRIEHDLGLGET